MLISYYIRRTYGNDRLYIADPNVAKSVSLLTGQRTIDYRHISALEAMGHSFRQVSDPRHGPSDRTVYANVPLTNGSADKTEQALPAHLRERPFVSVARDILAPSEDSDL